MKENILFGQPFDVEKYSAVIYACALVEVRNFLSHSTKTPFDRLKSKGRNMQDRITNIAWCLNFFPCDFTPADLEYKHVTAKFSVSSSEIVAFSLGSSNPGCRNRWRATYEDDIPPDIWKPRFSAILFFIFLFIYLFIYLFFFFTGKSFILFFFF